MRTNLILAVAAAVLAIPTTITLMTEGIRFTRYDQIPRLFEGFTKENIQFVVLEKAKRGEDGTPVADPDGKPVMDRLLLVRRDNKWLIGEGPLAGLPVRSSAPEDVPTKVLDHVQRIRRDREKLVHAQANDEELAARDLTEATGTVIRCLNNEQAVVAEMVLGKDASGGKWGEDIVKGFFVRRLDNREVVVYDALEAMHWNLSVQADDWVDKVIHEFQTAKVKTFSYRNPKGEVTFERQGPGSDPGAGPDAVPTSPNWKATKAPEGVGPVKQQDVTNLMSRFSILRAARFQQPLQGVDPNQVGLNPAEMEVSVVLEDGTLHRLEVGKKISDKPEYHARAEGTRYLIAVNEWDITSYERDPRDLFEPPVQTEAAPDPVKDPAKEENTPKEESKGGEKSGDGGN